MWTEQVRSVPQRIQYKLCLLVYKALRGLAPQQTSASLFQLSLAEVNYNRPCAMTSSSSRLQQTLDDV